MKDELVMPNNHPPKFLNSQVVVQVYKALFPYFLY